MKRKQMNLLQGTLDVLVLKALARESRHGYGVADWIRRTTDGTFEIEDGACVSGPCAGQALEAVPVVLDAEGRVVLIED